MPPWEAVLTAEDDFRAAQMAVAKVDARDMSELALKACLSGVYDSVHTSWPNNPAVIGFSVALNLISLTMAVHPRTSAPPREKKQSWQKTAPTVEEFLRLVAQLPPEDRPAILAQLRQLANRVTS